MIPDKGLFDPKGRYPQVKYVHLKLYHLFYFEIQQGAIKPLSGPCSSLREARVSKGQSSVPSLCILADSSSTWPRSLDCHCWSIMANSTRYKTGED